MSSTIVARSLAKAFGPTQALSGVDLYLDGGLTAVLGPNGAGKSTLLRCLATVMAPDDGSLTIAQRDPRDESDRIEIRRRLGYLPQDHGLKGRQGVFDTLDYFAALKQCGDTRRRRHLVYDALDHVGLADRATTAVDDLSGGMRQRLGLAQAILDAPSLLILDEPAAGLDPDERQRFRSIVAGHRQHATVLVSTHLTDEAAHCDRVLVLASGSVVFDGTPEQLANRADGRAWRQASPPIKARAWWMEPGGGYRCLGTPPPGVVPLAPTLEDGYLLTVQADNSSQGPNVL